MHLPHSVRLLLSAWMTFFLFGMAQAAGPACEQLFAETPQFQARALDFGLKLGKKQSLTPIELQNYSAIKADLWSTLKGIPKARRTNIENLLAAVEFFDYGHTADLILTNYLGNKGQTFDFTEMYDLSGEIVKGAPFKGFLNARDNFLRKETPEVSAELLAEIHKRIMANGVEEVSARQLGLWRNAHWTGNVSAEIRMTVQEAAVVKQNPYLEFTESDRGPGLLNESLWKRIKIWGHEKNVSLDIENSDLISGMIDYPYVATGKQSIIDMIKDSHPAVYDQVMNFRYENPVGADAPKKLEQALTKALVEERFTRFNKERKKIGKVIIGENEGPYIDLVADFQRDLVAIHPLMNGNGRTTRLLMNYLLTKEGLPPVRLVDPFLDIQVSQKDWREYVHKGVVNSAQLQADITFRLKNDFVVEYSPELLYPGLPEMVSISQKKQGSDKEIKNFTKAKVDSDQFGAFFKSLMQAHPELKQELKNDRVRAMNRIADLFVEYFSSKTIRYIHDKDGDLEIGLRLVEPDFINLFGINHAGSKYTWDAKINRWYDPNMLVWRGLSSSAKEPSRKELLSYFTTPTTHLASNSVFTSMNRGMTLIKAIKKDFVTYNKEAINGDVVSMATDHHQTGPRYSESYGFSTSKREVVGKAFAMGAMAVGEYGKQMDPLLQAKIKSRILVATYRAIKDVDLGRLKAFDPEFSYIYGRQAEVMAIGGTDPDAVMLIQRLDPKGNVIETLLRNKDVPNEVFVIEGRYVPEEGPLPKSKIKETVKILPSTN
jgi:hypothetical protein